MARGRVQAPQCQDTASGTHCPQEAAIHPSPASHTHHWPCPGRAGRLGHPCQHSQDWTLTHLLHLPAAPPALPLGEEVLSRAQPGQPNPNPSSLQGQILPIHPSTQNTDLRQLDSGGGDK